MPPFAFEVQESSEALVRPGLMKVALLNAAFDVRAHILTVTRSVDKTIIIFDRDVPQSLIVEKLAAKMGRSS